MKILILLFLFTSSQSFSWDFSERTNEVGLSFQHGFDPSVTIQEPQMIASGLAIGDVNGDGWDDIFVVTGETKDSAGSNINPNKLYISQKNGTFIDNASEFNLSSEDYQSSGPLIIDINGNGSRDLIFGSVGANANVTLYLNQDNNTFIKTQSEFPNSKTFGISAADTDKDGDLDLFFSRWLLDSFHAYFSNDGAGNFTDVTSTKINASSYQSSFTPVFVDINNNNWLDLLLTSDFSSSKYFLNDQSGNMEVQSRTNITDENGMGAAIGDYDNDGDFDWFVTSIYDQDGDAEGSWGVTGNRLYNNDGNGQFHDVSLSSGVNHGSWGWGTCFADFNNDMYLDIFHVNGFPSLLVGESDFVNDASRMFINNKDGKFFEFSRALNLNDTGMGRAILCFDNDRDGDIDILVSNNRGESKFYQNNLDNGNNYITLKLLQGNTNIDAIGAKIQLIAGGTTQIRQILAGGSFASSSPTAQHFGLAQSSSIDSILITWPDNTTQLLQNIEVNQYLTISKKPQIFGVVTDSITTQPIANIKLKLFSASGEFVTEVLSDENGEYAFTSLLENQYRLLTDTSNYVNQAYPSNDCGLAECQPLISELININTSTESVDFNLIPSSSYYPNLNGLWFNSQQSGHGLQVEVISSNGSPTIFASWYAHLNNETIWLTGIGPLNKGRGVIDLFITSGTSFPPNFNASDVVRTLWGSLNLEFSDLNNGHIAWSTLDDDFQNGTLDIERLSILSNNVENVGAFNACQNGTFYNPSQSGHGIMLEVLGDNAETMFISWFTYDPEQKQQWILASGNINGMNAELDAFYTINSSFPPDFNAADIKTIQWGTINLTKIDNDNLIMSWSPNSDHSRYGSNSVEFTRLTNVRGVDGLNCN
jgi:hypothetical protein